MCVLTIHELVYKVRDQIKSSLLTTFIVIKNVSHPVVGAVFKPAIKITTT